jgi:hypothetical protein
MSWRWAEEDFDAVFAPFGAGPPEGAGLGNPTPYFDELTGWEGMIWKRPRDDRRGYCKRLSDGGFDD